MSASSTIRKLEMKIAGQKTNPMPFAKTPAVKATAGAGLLPDAKVYYQGVDHNRSKNVTAVIHNVSYTRNSKGTKIVPKQITRMGMV